MELPKPKTVTQEVLLHMLENGITSIKSFPTLSGFRTRISELKNKYGVIFETRMLLGVNKYGREFRYAAHHINPEHLLHALSVYEKLTKQELEN